MRLAFLIFIISSLYSSNSYTQSVKFNPDSIIQRAGKQLQYMLQSHNPSEGFPRSYNVDQSVVMVKSSDWTSGFFPGMLWFMYEFTRQHEWKKNAELWTAGLEKEKNSSNTHDLGFMLYNSFGNGYRVTRNKQYHEILVQAARSLSSRYDPDVGCIRSWEHGDWEYPVIIDNMMNLELLFWASKATGDKSFYKIAFKHATTTLKNHFRANGSSYHVVDYNDRTGNVISKTTAQGYADESSWARGQAWGLYGFTMTWRETRDSIFLRHAEKIANYFIQSLPKNKIPYWDFNAPNIPFELQDASAAAIAASALLELSTFSKKNKNNYFKTAEAILLTLSSPAFFAKEKTNGNFILMHSVGSRPGNFETNVPLVYSDYYFLEALIRYQALLKKTGPK